MSQRSLATPVDTALRIGNASGFYGDRFAAFREMLEGGELDVLTGDYLAELTMLILGRQRLQHPDRGYAATFLRQMEDCLALALDRRVTIVTNAGGLNPSRTRRRAARARRTPRPRCARGARRRRRPALAGGRARAWAAPLTANAYLGAWGIAECVRAGADVVVTGRVTDASLVVGPAAAHFGWKHDDWDALAGATVAGHILECGAQATGGNYSFFAEHDVRHPGFPIAEVHGDGSCVITKHRGTGGAVTTETVTAQLLYEIGGPRYLGPDVVTRFDTITLTPDGEDRVRVSGVRGEPPPGTLKVCCNTLAGYRNEVVFVLCGLDIDAKAALVRDQMTAALAARPPAQIRWSLARTDHAGLRRRGGGERIAALRGARPRCRRRRARIQRAGRRDRARAAIPGFHLTAPPGDASPVGVYSPGFVPADAVEHVAVLPDGARVAIPPRRIVPSDRRARRGSAAMPAPLPSQTDAARAPRRHRRGKERRQGW